MLFIKKKLGILPALWLTSCVTVELLPESEISYLTTCDTSIEKARKNLLLEGYEIQNLTAESFNTDYKRDPKNDVKRSFLGPLLYSYDYKFIVVSEGKNKIRFTTRALETSYGTDRGGDPFNGYERAGNLGHVTGKTEVPVLYNVGNKKWHMDVKNTICR